MQPNKNPSEAKRRGGVEPILRSQPRRIGLGHPLGRDPGRTTSTYHVLSASAQSGPFYLAEKRTFLFGGDMAWARFVAAK